jgi:hypothetical protein
MKIIQEGNVYRRASWFEEHEKGIFTFGCVLIGVFCFAVLHFIK